MIYILYAVAAAMTVACIFDIRATLAGLKAGVAVEGNKIIVRVFGDHPTAKQLIAAWLVMDGGICVLVLVALHYSVYVVVGIAMGYMLAMVFKHIKGYRAWMRLLKPTKR